jgi:hypothetical protein
VEQKEEGVGVTPRLSPQAAEGALSTLQLSAAGVNCNQKKLRHRNSLKMKRILPR